MTGWWTRIRFWIRARLRGGAVRTSIDEELNYHVRMRTEELLAAGWSTRDAHRAARERFGNLQQIRAACQSLYLVTDTQRGDGMITGVWRDVKLALRSMTRQPGFAAVVIATLAVGIGANTAIFSVVDGVLLQQLPYANPDHLVRLYQADRANNTRFENFSAPDYFDVVERNTVFSQTAALENRVLTLTDTEGEPQRLQTVGASHTLMRLLGVEMAAGRWFTESEDAPDGERVVVLGHSLWTGRFGSDESVIGRTVVLDGEPYQIVGITDRELAYPYRDVQMWVPLRVGPTTRSRGQHNFAVLARVGPDLTLERAASQLATIASALEDEYPGENAGREMWPQPLLDSVVGRVREAIWVLAGAVAFVLLIACVNVANLVIARGTARQREVAIRVALGASRARLVRQFLTESLALAVVGGLVGVGVAVGGVHALMALNPTTLPRQANIGIDERALVFTLIAALATGIVFGLVPALRASHPDLQAPLKDGSNAATPGLSQQRLRAGLVVAEVALAVVLATGAGLLLKSFWRLQQVDPGFNPSNVLTVGLQLPAAKYPQQRADWPDFAEVHAFQRELVEKVAQIPGVAVAGLAVNTPTDPGWTTRFQIEGRPTQAAGEMEEVRIRVVSSGYFETAGISLLRGRLFEPRDDYLASPPVLIINEAMARRHFRDGDALGQHISLWGVSREIVGVVRDVRFMGVNEPTPPAVYPSFSHMPFTLFTLLARTRGDPTDVLPQVRTRISELDPDLALGSVTTLQDEVDASVGQPRFNTMALGLFAAVALLLAAIGIYGVISYGVGRRTHEIGVRLSLGASEHHVVRYFVTGGLLLTGIGIGLGVVGAALATRLMANMLFGVEPLDPTTFAAVAVVAALVAIVASYGPARRASRVDPVTALRAQ